MKSHEEIIETILNRIESTMSITPCDIAAIRFHIKVLKLQVRALKLHVKVLGEANENNLQQAGV